MKELDPFYSALSDPAALASEIREDGMAIIGTLCSYVPDELILSAGFHPMRLFPGGTDTPLADHHLQSYCCAPVRGILEDHLAGRLDYLSGIVFPQACDTIMRLSDIWRLNASLSFFFDLAWPSCLDTPEAKAYVITILERFKTQLDTAAGNSADQSSLSSAICLVNTLRRQLGRIYQAAGRMPEQISSSALSTVIRACMIMDRKRAVQATGELLRAVSEHGSVGPVSGLKPVVLAGPACDIPGFTRLIDLAGGFVTGDDLCTGQRWIDGLVDESQAPIEAVADRYLNRMICPAKHKGLETRHHDLVRLVRDNQARGIIFVSAKFCDPHAFDYPDLKTALDNENIPSLLIETDGSDLTANPETDRASGAVSGQMLTRIETFLEMI